MSSSSYIEEAKLLRARLRSRRSRTQEELAALHGKGEAFLSPGGKYYAAANEEDLIASIKAVPQAGPGERWRIRKFLYNRARVLGLSHLIPTNWEASGALEGQDHPSMGFGPGGPPPRD